MWGSSCRVDAASRIATWSRNGLRTAPAKINHSPVRSFSHDSSMSTAEIRATFLKYFAQKGHQVVPSSSVVPLHDPSLLFTNAGMVPFKKRFVGEDSLDELLKGNTRATSAQRCIRAGGKHNDLENVGFTPRHHTFFEMLGNFSFGDYFKEESISNAWTFLTRDLGIPAHKLRVTHFKEDEEARQLWRKIAGHELPDSEIIGLGMHDNFWTMGDGKGIPCGPCSEIFFDLGPSISDPEDRYLEIWNLVFMQYVQDGAGGFDDLPSQCVDTGMGLERIASVLQGVYSTHDSDGIRSLILKTHEAVQRLSNKQFEVSAPSYFVNGDAYREPSKYECVLRVLADHIRSASFMISDGIVPSNVGRGYVLRRIIRRATGFGYQLGIREPFLCKLVPDMIQSFEGPVGGSWDYPHPELKERSESIQSILSGEEEVFQRTIENGMHRLEVHINQVATTSNSGGELDPAVVFQMYDTFGFPFDLTALIAKSHGINVNVDEANKLMDQLQRGNSQSQGIENAIQLATTHDLILHDVNVSTRFCGYDTLHEPNATVLASGVSSSNAHEGWCCINPCPFYAESGGQVGDTGYLVVHDEGKKVKLEVFETIKLDDAPLAKNIDEDENLAGTCIDEHCTQRRNVIRYRISSQTDVDVVSKLKIGTHVEAVVDAKKRYSTSAHHTATHLLHAALRKVLGPQVVQAGSLVESHRLRFDFTWPRAMTDEQITKVESLVNEYALRNDKITTQQLELSEAKSSGTLMLFGEKYGDVVRVVRVGSNARDDDLISAELCGGTHCESTLQVYPFKLISESSVAAGTRRVEATVGPSAVKVLNEKQTTLEQIAQSLRCKSDDSETLVAKISQLKRDLKESKRMAEELRSAVVKTNDEPVWKGQIAGQQVWIHELPEQVVAASNVTDETEGNSSTKKKKKGKGSDPLNKLLVEQGRVLTENHSDVCHLLVCGNRIACAVSSQLAKNGTTHAGKILRESLSRIDGKGGGGPTFASGSVSTSAIDVGKLCDAIRSIY